MAVVMPGAVAPPLTDAAASRDPKVWQAAQKFEAMAIGQLLGPMFDTVDVAHSKFGGGEAEAAWRPMLVDSIGKQIEAHGGFGLAQPIYAAMLRAQEGGAQARAVQAATVHAGAAQAGAAQQTAMQQGATQQAAVQQARAQQGRAPAAGTRQLSAALPALRNAAHQPGMHP
jgi:peptidoglycan hydrolase FlgJ